MDEIEEMDKKLSRYEDYNSKEIVKYFDNMHNKLFAFQLFFIAGYISLIAIDTVSLSPWWLIIPISCVGRLIYIDYSIMNKCRQLSQFKSLSEDQRNQVFKGIDNTNKLSLEVILETVLLTILFMWFLIKNFT